MFYPMLFLAYTASFALGGYIMGYFYMSFPHHTYAVGGLLGLVIGPLLFYFGTKKWVDSVKGHDER